ncbi:MAG: hypothetical protein R2747_22490 [Pyrinomonadaceae bacterium]
MIKARTGKITLIFIGLCIFLFAQPDFAQKKPVPVDLSYVLSKLSSDKSRPAEKINQKLIAEIRKRKVDFALDPEDEETIKKTGGNDLLIQTIDENASEKVKEHLRNAMYDPSCGDKKRDPQCTESLLKIGKQFIRVFANDPDYEAQVQYLKHSIPRMEEKIAKYKLELDSNQNYNKFNREFKDKNWKGLFEAGAEILKREPEFVDVSLVLAGVGFDNLTDKSIDPEQVVYYAEKSIELLEAGKASSEKYGVYQYQYKTEEFPDGRVNALGWMNYIAGHVKYFRLDQKAGAVPFFYGSTKYESKAKGFAVTYKIIGEFYLEKLADPDQSARKNFFLDRAIDAYARALHFARTDPSVKKSEMEKISDKLQKLLTSRFGKEMSGDFDLRKFTSETAAKPMPDPTNSLINFFLRKAGAEQPFLTCHFCYVFLFFLKTH